MYKYDVKILENFSILSPQITFYRPVILDWVAESHRYCFRTHLIQASAVAGRMIILEEVCS